MIFSVCRDNGLSFSQGTTTKPPPRTFSDSAPGHCCGSSSTKAKETITYWVLPFIRRSLMLAHLILCKLSIMMILILETQTLKHREIKWLAGIIQLIMASTAKYGSNFIAKKRYIQKKKAHKGQCQKWGPSCSLHPTTLLWGIPLSYYHEYQEWQIGRQILWGGVSSPFP